MSCKCESKTPCKRVLVNGTIQYGLQCQNCGSWQSRKYKSFGLSVPSPLPEYDEEIKRNYRKRTTDEYVGKMNKEASEREDEYNQYIGSDKWKRKRIIVMERDNYMCQGCLKNRADHVHHLTYDRFGNELLFDLVALCWICHDIAHGKTSVDIDGILKNNGAT